MLYFMYNEIHMCGGGGLVHLPTDEFLCGVQGNVLIDLIHTGGK